MKDKILPYKCACGGVLKHGYVDVEFFGIDFGQRKAEICTRCGAEYLSDETLAEVEAEVKKRKLFGLERNVSITKSGNSLVIRIPPEIAKFSGISYKDTVRMYPVEKKRIELEVGG